MNAPNVGVAADPEPQGYDLIEERPGVPYDPFRDGTKVYGCPECGATWNADDLHLRDCTRRTTAPGTVGRNGHRRRSRE